MKILDMMLNHSWLLIVIEVGYMFLCHYFIASHLVNLNYSDIGVGRIILFSIFMTMTVMIPMYFSIYGWPFFISRDYLATWSLWSRFLIQYRNPVWILLYGVFARKLLKLSKEYITGSLLVVFCYAQLFTLLSDSLEYVYRLFSDKLKVYTGYNLIHILLIIVVIMGNLYISRYIRRNAHKFKRMFEVSDEKSKWVGVKNFVLSTVFWLVLSSMQLLFTSSSYQALFAEQFFYPFMILFLLMVFIQTMRISMLNVELSSVKLSNTTLFQDINDLRGMRHDMNNMLQLYDAYIKTGQYELLEEFHNELFEETVKINENLNLHLYLKNTPALYGLFMATVGKAEKAGVDFQVKDIYYLKNVALSDLDLCRVLSNILNNAIEHAAESKEKKVVVIIYFGTKEKNEITMTVSNTADDVIDIGRIFLNGYTTKKGHTGRGLGEVNKILAHYYGSAICSSYDAGIFTIYLTLPCKPKQEE